MGKASEKGQGLPWIVDPVLMIVVVEMMMMIII
jgi:hypothetical protein